MIEFTNLTNGRLGAMNLDDFRAYVAANPEAEIMAWADCSGDTEEIHNLTNGKERDASEILTLADWVDDELDTDVYWFLSDDEIEKRADEYLDEYIDDCIMPEIPEWVRPYFDADSWKRDAFIERSPEEIVGVEPVDYLTLNGRKFRVHNLYQVA